MYFIFEIYLNDSQSKTEEYRLIPIIDSMTGCLQGDTYGQTKLMHMNVCIHLKPI